jgi:hypothetical protein
MNIEKFIAFILIIVLLVGCSDVNNKDKTKEDLLIKKDGIELTAKLDKVKYSKEEDIIINATAKNVSGKKYIYGTRDSCDNGFDYEVDPALKRLYDIKRDGEKSRACLMVTGEATLDVNEEVDMKIELSPRDTLDRNLYKNDELNVYIDFRGTDAKLELPIDIQKNNKKRDIPATSEEAAQHYLNNEVILEWMKKEPLNRKNLSVRNHRDNGDSWRLEYYLNGPNSYHIVVDVESDTGKFIKAEYINSGYGDDEIIIPMMVLRTSFEKILKDNPNKTYKVQVQSVDLNSKHNGETPDNEEEKNIEHIENIKKYNGKVINYSKWIYTYWVEAKSSDILEMAKDKEWEYIRLVDKDNPIF